MAVLWGLMGKTGVLEHARKHARKHVWTRVFHPPLLSPLSHLPDPWPFPQAHHPRPLSALSARACPIPQALVRTNAGPAADTRTYAHVMAMRNQNRTGLREMISCSIVDTVVAAATAPPHVMLGRERHHWSSRRSGKGSTTRTKGIHNR